MRRTLSQERRENQEEGKILKKRFRCVQRLMAPNIQRFAIQTFRKIKYHKVHQNNEAQTQSGTIDKSIGQAKSGQY